MRVKFVIFKKELVALFPSEKENDNCILSYQHVGQHGAASYSLMRCKKATKEEYVSLLQELKNIGYDDLIIMNEK